MSSPHLEVTVVDRAAVLWSGDAEYVSIPAVDGRLGILPGRQPVLAVLVPGTVQITQLGGEIISFDVAGGLASVDSDIITVVAKAADMDIDFT